MASAASGPGFAPTISQPHFFIDSWIRSIRFSLVQWNFDYNNSNAENIKTWNKNSFLF